jgi:hypothetical protein
MSFSMWGVPLPVKKPAPKYLDLKHAFARQFIPGSDGSLRGSVEISDPAFRAVITTWLRGYMCDRPAKTRESAQELLDFIDRHEQGVVIWVGDWMDGPYGDEVEPEDE